MVHISPLFPHTLNFTRSITLGTRGDHVIGDSWRAGVAQAKQGGVTEPPIESATRIAGEVQKKFLSKGAFDPRVREERNTRYAAYFLWHVHCTSVCRVDYLFEQSRIKYVCISACVTPCTKCHCAKSARCHCAQHAHVAVTDG